MDFAALVSAEAGRRRMRPSRSSRADDWVDYGWCTGTPVRARQRRSPPAWASWRT
ncbi:MAG: hypothetical protein ACLR4Z_04915 [Butyricicoccaceae bacterium]